MPTCAASATTAPAVVRTAPIASVIWMWDSSEAATAILRVYRKINGLNQIALADRLEYDPSYTSMIETGRRAITDATVRRQIADPARHSSARTRA